MLLTGPMDHLRNVSVSQAQFGQKDPGLQDLYIELSKLQVNMY